ncbi:unnamed protein product [Paramecium octaurelia]|uniref:Uncharacterized protein n=1 Tax=Paramecium octaurelia TaxID=43137 RepID=A0A8S1TR95_PAROT|nr:unnamed protein product [Paramecium octaurelia]
MQINMEFLCFEQNEKIIDELAAKHNHQEIIDFCDRQIFLIEFAQSSSSENSTQILDDSQELNKPLDQSSGSFLLSRVDSYGKKYQIEYAYDFYYKKKIKSLQILQRYEEIIECCERLLILCQETNQEGYCQHEKAKALSNQTKKNEFIQKMGLDKQENKHNFNYYKQIVKDLKSQGLIEEAIACWEYGMQNNQFSEKFSHKKQKLLNKIEKKNEAKECQKQLEDLCLS